MPLMWLGIMGIGLSSSFRVPNADYDYLTFVSPGIIGMSLLFTSIFSAISVIWDKQFGFLKEMLVSPISRTSIVLGKILGSATISIMTGIIVLLMSIALNGISAYNLNPISILASVAFMMLVAISFVSIGLIIASRLNSMEGFQVIMSALVMPLFFLSGAFFPIENVPTWMKVLAHADPLMYGVDGLRGSLLGVSQQSLLLDLSVLAGFSVIMIITAAFVFRRIQ